MNAMSATQEPAAHTAITFVPNSLISPTSWELLLYGISNSESRNKSKAH